MNRIRLQFLVVLLRSFLVVMVQHHVRFVTEIQKAIRGTVRLRCRIVSLSQEIVMILGHWLAITILEMCGEVLPHLVLIHDFDTISIRGLIIDGAASDWLIRIRSVRSSLSLGCAIF